MLHLLQSLVRYRTVQKRYIQEKNPSQVAGVSTDRPYHTDRPRHIISDCVRYGQTIEDIKYPKHQKVSFMNQYELTRLYERSISHTHQILVDILTHHITGHRQKYHFKLYLKLIIIFFKIFHISFFYSVYLGYGLGHLLRGIISPHKYCLFVRAGSSVVPHFLFLPRPRAPIASHQCPLCCSPSLFDWVMFKGEGGVGGGGGRRVDKADFPLYHVWQIIT